MADRLLIWLLWHLPYPYRYRAILAWGSYKARRRIRSWAPDKQIRVLRLKESIEHDFFYGPDRG